MTTSGLRVDVLGSATPYARPDNPCSGYLLSSGDTRIWMDAGAGTLAALQRHVPLTDLDAIWISHAHADHSADLLTAYYALLYADLQPDAPIPLYGPPGIADRLAGFLTNGAERSPVEEAFDVHELHDGHRTEIGGLSLTTRSVEHGIPAFAVRVADGNASLVYSGDTAPCPHLTELATDCDALLCEAESAEATSPQVHHTPEDAGRTATDAGARRLIVTHVGPFLTPAQALDRAATTNSGPIDYAKPEMSFDVD